MLGTRVRLRERGFTRLRTVRRVTSGLPGFKEKTAVAIMVLSSRCVRGRLLQSTYRLASRVDTGPRQGVNLSRRNADHDRSPPLKRDGDRNLLFGILALQMDFISRDALVGP